MRYVYHTFRATETIDGVIRLLGRHAYTKEELDSLRKVFNEINETIVPRPGQRFKIPLPLEADDGFGNVLEVTPVLSNPGTDQATPGDDRSHEPATVVDSVPEPVVAPAPPPAPVPPREKPALVPVPARPRVDPRAAARQRMLEIEARIKAGQK